MAHNDERPHIAERVGNALSRGNLRQHDRSGRLLTGTSDLDVVAALGVVGIGERLADAVYRLKYANDHKSYYDALQGVRDLARSMDAKSRWKVRREHLKKMAQHVLDYWLNDSCPTCTGVKYEVIRGSPHLSDRACKACHGSGKKEMPWNRRVPGRPEGKHVTHEKIKEWDAESRDIVASMSRHRALLIELERIEVRVGDALRTKLYAR